MISADLWAVHVDIVRYRTKQNDVLDSLKATTMYFVEWFIISVSLFAQVQEESHLFSWLPQFDSWSPFIHCSFTLFLIPIFLAFSPMRISAIICSSFHTPSLSFRSLSNLRATFPYVLPAVWLCGRTSEADVVFGVSVWGTEMFCLSFVAMTSPPVCPHVYPVPESKPLLMSSSVDKMNSCWHSWLLICICFISRLIRATKPSENTVILAVVPQKWV